MDKKHGIHAVKKRAPLGDRRMRGGFTLIEILVVVSIISLLVAMLLPVLSQAREAARAVQCLSQQRQVGIQAHYYANDYNGWMTQYWVGVQDANGLVLGHRSNNRFNYNQFLAYLYSHQDAAAGPFTIYQCPAFSAATNGREQVYGWRKQELADQSARLYQPTVTGGFFDLHHFEAPSRSYLAADTYHESGAGLQNVAGLNLIGASNPFSGDRGLHLRHSGSINVLFADASASARNQDGVREIGWRGWYNLQFERVQP